MSYAQDESAAYKSLCKSAPLHLYWHRTKNPSLFKQVLDEEVKTL
jgi:hypothetical protein